MHGVYEVHLRTQKQRLLFTRPTPRQAGEDALELIDNNRRRYRGRYGLSIQPVTHDDAETSAGTDGLVAEVCT